MPTAHRNACKDANPCHRSPMSIDLANELRHTGRSHAAASCLLYRATIQRAEEEKIPDPKSYAFNGPTSLSIQYLLGLGLELMLKAAVVAWDPTVDEKYLKREIGHDLIAALDEAEKRGFASKASHLREILKILREPYMQHWFRYQQPDQFPLPDDFDQIVPVLEILEQELDAKLGPETSTAA